MALEPATDPLFRDGTTPPGDDPAQDDWPCRSPLESLVRGSAAWLATPFLLVIMVAVVGWLKVSGKLPVHRQMMFASVWATSLTWPQLMGSA